MGSYRIEWKDSARKEVKHVERGTIGRILAAVESLGVNPRPAGCRKLVGSSGTYRIRVGNYRVHGLTGQRGLVFSLAYPGSRSTLSKLHIANLPLKLPARLYRSRAVVYPYINSVPRCLCREPLVLVTCTHDRHCLRQLTFMPLRRHFSSSNAHDDESSLFGMSNDHAPNCLRFLV